MVVELVNEGKDFSGLCRHPESLSHGDTTTGCEPETDGFRGLD
jgi:hypothetical protein